MRGKISPLGLVICLNAALERAKSGLERSPCRCLSRSLSLPLLSPCGGAHYYLDVSRWYGPNRGGKCGMGFHGEEPACRLELGSSERPALIRTDSVPL